MLKYFIIVLLLIIKNFSYSAQFSNLERAEEEVKFKNAEKLLELDRNELAIPLLKEYIEIYEDGIYKAEVLKYLGDIYFKQYNYIKSIYYYEKLYEEFNDIEDGITGFYNMGLCYSKMGNEAKAIEVFKYILENYPASSAALDARIQLEIKQVLKD